MGRLDHIQHEWRLNTHQKVRETDKAFYALYINDEYKLPKNLPDGKYVNGIPSIRPFEWNKSEKKKQH